MNTCTGSKCLPQILSVVLGIVCAATASAQTVDEIIDLHVRALGGLDAIKAVKSIQRKGDASLGGMAGDMVGTMEIAIVPGKKYCQNIVFDIGSSKAGYNGTDAWAEDTTQGLRKVSGPEAQSIIDRSMIDLLVAVKLGGAPGVVLTKLDDETVNESEHYVLQVSTELGAEGPSGKIYVDKKTHLKTQRIVKQDNPQLGGEITIVTSTSDYEEYGGVKLPKREKIDIGNGMLEFEFTFTETKVNEELDERIFDMPKSDTP